MQTKYAMENFSLKFSKQLKIYADKYAIKNFSVLF
jgi:hypothetical protein